jgi:zinc D-Ala-D-Ala carboxypeptidase
MSRRTRLSRHFTIAEFDSHDGAEVPLWRIPELQKLCRNWLEPLRDEYGPVFILSGFRSDSHNAAVGGAPQSFHRAVHGRAGAAADVRCKRGQPADWYRFLDRRGAPGLGLYTGHVHVDTRPGGRVRW